MNWQRWIRPGLVTTIPGRPDRRRHPKRSIGRDLAGEVNASLAATGQGWATADASARDITIKGTAPTPESQQAAIRLAQAVPGVHSVTDRTSLLPIAVALCVERPPLGPQGDADRLGAVGRISRFAAGSRPACPAAGGDRRPDGAGARCAGRVQPSGRLRVAASCRSERGHGLADQFDARRSGAWRATPMPMPRR